MLRGGDLLLQPPSQGAAMAGSSASMPWLLPMTDRGERSLQAAAARRSGSPSEGFPARDTPEQRQLSQMAAERLAREQQRRGVVLQRPSQGKVPQQPPEAAAVSGQQAGIPAADPSQEQQEAAPRAEEDLEQEEAPVIEPPRLFPAPEPFETEPPRMGGRRPGRVLSALQASQRTSGRAIRQVSAKEAGMRAITSQARASADRSGLAASRRRQHIPSNSESEAMHQAMKEQLRQEEEQLKQEEEQREHEEAKKRPRRRTRKATMQDETEYLMPEGAQPAPQTVQVRSSSRRARLVMLDLIFAWPIGASPAARCHR